MSRILNKKELKKLKRLKIIRRVKSGAYYHCLRESNCIVSDMIGTEIKKLNNQWFISPWMIKENWEKTEIFK